MPRLPVLQLWKLSQDGALAAIQGNSSCNTTHFYKIATMNGVTLWMSDATILTRLNSHGLETYVSNGATNNPPIVQDECLDQFRLV